MDTTKIVEALKDLRSKRDAINTAISSLESALEIIGGSPSQAPAARIVELSSKRNGKSSLDYAIEVLTADGRLHVEQLAEKVSQLSGREVTRATLDGGISREIRERGDDSRFERVEPGVYGLRSKPDQNQQLQ